MFKLDYLLNDAEVEEDVDEEREEADDGKRAERQRHRKRPRLVHVHGEVVGVGVVGQQTGQERVSRGQVVVHVLGAEHAVAHKEFDLVGQTGDQIAAEIPPKNKSILFIGFIQCYIRSMYVHTKFR